MEFKNFLQSSKAKHIVAGIGIAVIALLIFQAGVFVGFRKAVFAGRLGDNYYKTFGDKRGDNRELFSPFGMRGMMNSANSHGTIGQIVSFALPEIIVADREGVEKTILFDNKTEIRQFRDSVKVETLKVGDTITVIGEPDDMGRIEARLVRVMPTPPDDFFGNKASTATSSKKI